MEFTKKIIQDMGYGVGSPINIMTKGNVCINKDAQPVPEIFLEQDMRNNSHSRIHYSPQEIRGYISKLNKTGIEISSFAPSDKKYDPIKIPIVSNFLIEYNSIYDVSGPFSEYQKIEEAKIEIASKI